ncbi:MAG: DUF6483 family protein [bacterium]
MIERDYILRIINDLARVLSKVLLHKENKRYDEAQRDMTAAGKLLLGADPAFLDALSTDELIRLLRLSDRFDIEKCLLMAELLRERGEVAMLQQHEAEGVRGLIRSLTLYLELHSEFRDTLPKEISLRVSQLITSLAEFELPADLQWRLVRYYELQGQFARAEDTLFQLLGMDASYYDEAKKFYNRLAVKTDEELERGNLPREELKSGLASIEQLFHGTGLRNALK